MNRGEHKAFSEPAALDWMADALCRESYIDPAIFFPPSSYLDANIEGYAEARRVCGLCPVRDACLAHFMRTESPSERHGMVGGLTPRERRALYRGKSKWARDLARQLAGVS